MMKQNRGKIVWDWPKNRLESWEPNKLLPESYRDEIPFETEFSLAEIKKGLALSVASGDVDSAGLQWTRAVERYDFHPCL
jgi:hypothetical protein